MKEHRIKKLCIGIGMIMLIALAVGVTTAYLCAQVYKSILQEQIGVVYEVAPEAADELLRYLLTESTALEMKEKGAEALEFFGYTQESFYYISKQNPLMKLGRCFVCLLVILLAGGILLLLRMYRLVQKQLLESEKELWKLHKRKSNEEYEQEQNRRLQSFIENIAHQIKTPLSRISTSLDIMCREDLDAEERQLRAEECFGHLEGVSTLMKRLLDIGRLEAGKILFQKERIVMPELLQDVARSCDGSGERIKLELAPMEEESSIFYGDYDWLREAFLNLIVNCLEHDRSRKAIEISCKREPEFFRLTIRDHGEGFNEVEMPMLFDRFYQSESAKKGHVGIGLNLAKLIIEGHFGAISAQNHQDGGAVFEIMLPVYQLKKK